MLYTTLCVCKSQTFSPLLGHVSPQISLPRRIIWIVKLVTILHTARATPQYRLSCGDHEVKRDNSVADQEIDSHPRLNILQTKSVINYLSHNFMGCWLVDWLPFYQIKVWDVIKLRHFIWKSVPLFCLIFLPGIHNSMVSWCRRHYICIKSIN